MRRLFATLTVLAALVVAGCGGDDSGGALDTALSYLPKDVAFAVALDTDTEGDQFQALRKLLDEFPFGDQIQENLLQQLESSSNLSFQDDVKPVLGNPFVAGAWGQRGGLGSPGRFVAAIQAKDQGALDDLIDRSKTIRKVGEASGATLYEDGGTLFAVEDDVVVFASDQAELKRALARADTDDHFDEGAFEEGLEGLPDEALARVYADVESLLKAAPGSADALRIKWVAALRELGLTATAKDNAIEIDFRLRTEGDLSDDDLPIAPGGEAPPVVKRDGEIGFGIRDLAHIVKFAENSGQSIDPAGFGDYAQAKKTIDRQLGVNLDDDLIGQLTGDVSASLSIGGDFGVRAELKDPGAFERTLAKVADVLPSFAEGAGLGTVELSKPRAGDDFYELTQAGGGGRVVFGVVDGSLVVASDRARADALAAAKPVEVPGAEGSVTLSADAGELASTLLQQLGPALGLPDLGGFGAGLVTRPLGDLNGYARASTDELRGKLTLAIE